ncbi:heme o synthase [Amnibacterium kyonggiense]|uniref:Protoheme IX farnesyltransferase n=1 Tax=Amnibacterium kyonggiense TaxID=595671 RepID=A0A4R7FLW6_9MICO|nr:heme o synthase [Amnibacterium kyonggiense]TDS77376.1 protoheme IX farnesyltransferase [Amnibacterium kyonggiense]
MSTTVRAESGRAQPSRRDRVPFGRQVRGYVALMKLRVVELLLVTTIPVMILAVRGVPDLLVVAATLVGGTLSAGAANAFNMVIDRDIDRVMHRTRHRPLVTGDLTPRQALVFALLLTVVSTLVLGLLTTWLAAALSLAAIGFYVFIYTMWLKRRTSQNIIWGGIAGCFPVLIGWAAVTGTLAPAAWVLFALIFLWTPPHYWPLSMRYRDDYSSVGVPMLGAVRGPASVGLQTVLYAWATLACSLLLIPVAGMGPVYALVALGAGGWFVLETHRLYARALAGEEIAPMRVFHASIGSLSLVFLGIAVDALLFR